MEEKVQGIRSINGRYKIDGAGWGGELVRIVWDMQKPKNLCMTHGHELSGVRGMLVGVGMQGGGE